MVTERGTSFGYHDLIVDMRVCSRCARRSRWRSTHARGADPGAGEGASSGDRRYVAPLARAAAAARNRRAVRGDPPDPEHAPCDPACQIRIADLDALLADVVAIREALDRPRG